MYLEHFALNEHPFSLTPDTAFFLNRSGYQDALNVLLVALRSGEGFVKAVGEVGTGKTVLCRKLLNTLGEEFVSAYIHNPYLGPTDLLHAVADELEVGCEPGCGQHLLLKRLSTRLVALHAAGKRVVLCLDEVQAMPLETLETMRLLTNLETEKRKLLQVVLFGQPELDRQLGHDAVRQLRQRITFSYRLRPMSRTALDAYVAHRLQVAGREQGGLFAASALDAVFAASAGVPRLVNVLCHKAMLVAYGKGLDTIDRASVRAAVADGELERGAGGRRVGDVLRWLAAGLGAALLTALGAGLAAS